MSTETGVKQLLIQGQTGTLSYRLLDDDGDPVTISTKSAKTYNASGTEITHGGSLAISGDDSEIVTLTITTVSAATWAAGDGYYIVWTLNSKDYKAFFEVAAREFVSQLSDDDLVAVDGSLSATTDYSAYRMMAWRRIATLVRKALRASEHLVFYPEAFFDAHLELSLAYYYRQNAFNGSEEDWAKYQSHEREAMALLKNELVNIDYDADGDGLRGDGDTHHNKLSWLDREFAY